MLRHRGVGDGELAWRCQQTAAEGAGMLGCQCDNRFADFCIRLLQLLIFILTSTRKRSYSQKRNTVSKFSTFGWSPIFEPVETSQGYTFEREVNQRRVVVYRRAMQVYP
jgi:hypothetical protein